MSFVSGEFYHVCQRGIEGKIIFPEKSYYERFKLGLAAFNTPKLVELRNTAVALPYHESEQLIDMIAYILMSNHIHLLVHSKNEQDAATFFRKKFGGYTHYFNIRNNRRGVLFQGRPVVKRIDSDSYLKTVLNYIHLNALDRVMPEWREGGITDVEKAKKALLEYPWSSLTGILGHKDDRIINKSVVLSIINPDELMDSMLQWSAIEENDANDELAHLLTEGE